MSSNTIIVLIYHCHKLLEQVSVNSPKVYFHENRYSGPAIATCGQPGVAKFRGAKCAVRHPCPSDACVLEEISYNSRPAFSDLANKSVISRRRIN
jgi:hypothetical protein